MEEEIQKLKSEVASLRADLEGMVERIADVIRDLAHLRTEDSGATREA